MKKSVENFMKHEKKQIADDKEVVPYQEVKKTRLVRPPESWGQRWNRCVRDCRVLMMGRDMARIKVCELALEACKLDDKTWEDNNDQLEKFAFEIGVATNQLLHWLTVKHYMYDRLNKKYRESFKWSIGNKVTKQITSSGCSVPSKTKASAAYAEELEVVEKRQVKKLSYKVRLDHNMGNIEALIKKSSKKQLDEMQDELYRMIDILIKKRGTI